MSYIKTINQRTFEFAFKQKEAFLKGSYDYFNSNNVHADSDNYFFLTLRFKYPQKSIYAAKEKLKRILYLVYCYMLGTRWKNKYFKNITFIEHGKNNFLHTHTVINIRNDTKGDLLEAFNYVVAKHPELYLTCDYKEGKSEPNENYTPIINHMLIKPKTDYDGLLDYLVKEYNFKLEHIDFENFYPAEALFGIDYIDNKNLPRKPIKTEYKDS
jgi:hypothetical protein